MYSSLVKQASLANLIRPGSFEWDPWRIRNQWHIWPDGDAVVSGLLLDGRWNSGPGLKVEDLMDGSALQAAASSITRKRQALGILYHVTDELALASVRPQMSRVGSLKVARAMLRDNPARVVDERPVSGAAYTLLPLPGSDSAVAVRFIQDRFKGVAALARRHPEIRIGAYSAPLEFITNIGWFTNLPGEGTRCAAAIVIYRRITFISLIVAGGLGSVAAIPTAHHDPQNVALGRMQSELQKLGVDQCDLWIWDLTSESLGDEAERSYQSYFQLNPQLAARTRSVNFAGRQDVWKEVAKQVGSSFPLPIEMYGSPAVNAWLRGGRAAEMVGEAVRTTVFLCDSAAPRISAGQNAAIVAARFAGAAASLALVIAVVLFARDAYETLNNPSWNLKAEVADQAAKESLRLRMIQQAVKSWNEVLQPWSQAWSAMEVASRLVPESLGAKLVQLDYSFSPVGQGSEAALPVEARWLLKGSAPISARPHLESLDAAGVSSLIEQVVSITNSETQSASPALGKPAATVRVESNETGDSDGSTLGFLIDVTWKFALPNSFSSSSKLPPLAEVLKPLEVSL